MLDIKHSILYKYDNNNKSYDVKIKNIGILFFKINKKNIKTKIKYMGLELFCLWFLLILYRWS